MKKVNTTEGNYMNKSKYINKRIIRTSYIFMIGILTIIPISATIINNTHAESSSTSASVTVANTISLTLTGGDLVIDNLTPGNASDSNVITANVTSNSPYGINLSATTGTSGGTTSLVNTADSNLPSQILILIKPPFLTSQIILGDILIPQTMVVHG